MNKIIWTLWLQGRDSAPEIVKRCLDSWERMNPDWDFRCLDADTVGLYVDLSDFVNLQRQTVTAASLSDIIRIALLHEFGGVWVDATLYCNQQLNDWLPSSASSGFFAFCNPGPDRLLASWFLASAPHNCLVGKWAAKTYQYWQQRDVTNDYFWFHHLFGELYNLDHEARAAWNLVPKISADGPHSIQKNLHAAECGIDLSAPVYKLSHQLDPRKLEPGNALDELFRRDKPTGRSLLWKRRPKTCESSKEITYPTGHDRPMPFIGLKVSTENLGDHIQLMGADLLLSRVGIKPEFRVDRDDEIASAPSLEALKEPAGMLVNGWFKTNPAEWPPHRNLRPLYLGFHIRLFQSPSLVGDTALKHYRKYGPIGCRDNYTLSLLRSHKIESFISNCLTLLLPKRLPDPDRQNQVFVVSRDERILDYLPTDLQPVTFVKHYSGSFDFETNMSIARDLIEKYRKSAKLIVTTLLHCALPAIAMGIPVIIFYPINEKKQHSSDRERFSTLERMIRVYHLTEIKEVDWRGQVIEVGHVKRSVLETFFRMTDRWKLPLRKALGPIAPHEALPVPSGEPETLTTHLLDIGRLQELQETKTPDRVRWGNPLSYKSDWAARAEIASSLIEDGASIFEVGAGVLEFRKLVQDRCSYVGSDLQPLSKDLFSIDLDRDDIPGGEYDYVVALGVFEYLNFPENAIRKICKASKALIITYCCIRDDLPRDQILQARMKRGWVNAFTENEFVAMIQDAGQELISCTRFNESSDFKQNVMKFHRRA